jgi:hypothetical protein
MTALALVTVITIVFLAITGALGLLVYLSYRLNHDEDVEYVSLDVILDDANAPDVA